MEKTIKENSKLVKELFNRMKISEESLKNLAEIYKLKNNIKNIKVMTSNFYSGQNEKVDIFAEIYLKKKINSEKEVVDYIANNTLINRENIREMDNGAYGDYGFNIGDLETYFFNPK